LFNWGESPVGQWKLKLENLDLQQQTTGKLINIRHGERVIFSY